MVRIRPILVSAALAAAAAVPAAAAVQGPQLTTLKVRECHAGDTSQDRSATFFSQMRAVSGSQRMAMRFTLYQRTADHPLQPVPSSDLQQWRRSRPGVQTFGFAQKVTGLQNGGAYSAAVDYRWLDGSGKLIQTRHRVSGSCREDGPLPNLTIVGVSARAGQTPGTELYGIQVLNDGAAPAHLVTSDLFVDGSQADTATIADLAAGETATVRVSGPSCQHRIRAVVDRLGLINETTKDDNTVRAACPLLSP